MSVHNEQTTKKTTSEKAEKTSSDSDRIVTDNTTDTDSFIGDISEAVDTAIDDAKDIVSDIFETE